MKTSPPVKTLPDALTAYKEIASFDSALCKQLAGGNSDLAATLLKMFLSQLAEFSSNITYCYQTQNMPELLEHIHKLHGGCCYCGVAKLKTLTAHLESALRQHQQATIDSLLPLILAEINYLIELNPSI